MLREPFKQAVKAYYLRQSGKVLPYGMGCAWLGREELNDRNIRQDTAVLLNAYRNGYRFFDTSMNYGESEVIVGHFLQKVPRDAVFLATKSAYIPEDASSKAAAELVQASLQDSLRRLRTPRIDLFQLHEIVTLSNILDQNGVVQVLNEAKRQGLIRYAGVTTRFVELLKDAARSGEFDSVQSYGRYNPVDQSATALYAVADCLGVGTINAGPLAGFFTGANPRDMQFPYFNERRERQRSAAIQLYDQCQTWGVSMRALALQFPLRNPHIDLTLTGPANSEQVASGLASLLDELDPVTWDRWEAWKDMNIGPSAYDGCE